MSLARSTRCAFVSRGSGQAASHRREVGGVDRWREVYPGIRTSLDVTRGSGQAASHRREVGGVDRCARYIQEFALRLMSRAVAVRQRATDARSVGSIVGARYIQEFALRLMSPAVAVRQRATDARSVGSIVGARYIQEFALRLMSRGPGPTWVQRWVPTCVDDRVSTDRGEADPTGCPC